MEAGAQKIVRGSGPDVPEDREAAKERFGEFLLRMDRELPSNVLLALEPTDRAIGKHFLYGPVAETASLIRKMRAAGLSRLGMLLDMGRVPLMGATLDSAVAEAGAFGLAFVECGRGFPGKGRDGILRDAAYGRNGCR